MKRYRIRKGSLADKTIRHIVPITASAIIAIGALGTMQIMYNSNPVEAKTYNITGEQVVMDRMTRPEAAEVEVPQRYDVPLSYELQDYITEHCKGTGIESSLIIAMIAVESDYKAACVGDNGYSKGLMQIQQRYHQWAMDASGATDLMDPYDNVATGITILTNLLDSGNGECWALSAYNGGAKYADRLQAHGVQSEYFVKVKNKQVEIERLAI